MNNNRCRSAHAFVALRRPLGSANDLGPLGFKFRLPIPMGVPYSGGTVVTKGG